MSKRPPVILVPTDFGDASSAALEQAIVVAKKFGAEVVLIHAFEIPVMGLPEGPVLGAAELTGQIIDGSRVALDDAVRAHADCGVPIRTLLRQSDPWRGIVAAAEELGACFIVMGTHGRTGLSRAVIGSVAEKVVRMATVPVITVHAGLADATKKDVDRAAAVAP